MFVYGSYVFVQIGRTTSFQGRFELMQGLLSLKILAVQVYRVLIGISVLVFQGEAPFSGVT